MAHVILPAPLRRLTGGAGELEVEGATAAEVLRRLQELHPEIAGWVLDERGELRRHVNVFVGEQRAGLETAVGAGDSLYVLQAISGGSPRATRDGVEVLVGTKKGLFILRGRVRRAARGRRAATSRARWSSSPSATRGAAPTSRR